MVANPCGRVNNAFISDHVRQEGVNSEAAKGFRLAIFLCFKRRGNLYLLFYLTDNPQ